MKFIAVSNGKFLCACGDAVSEYPDAKKFGSVIQAVWAAERDFEGAPFEVYDTEAYAEGGMPAHIS